MKHLFLLALKSALNRRYTLSLTVIAIALSVAMLLGVARMRDQVHAGFSQSIAGTDLVVGARTSPVQLMLYAVFRIGEATNNITWKTYQDITKNPLIAWAIPISLGDSHHGFPVVGTTDAYFKYFKYGDAQSLKLASGKPFKEIFEAVLGAEVANQLHYKINDHITLSHGMTTSGADINGMAQHADKPFTVVGILKPTGTPVDRTVHISLEAISAIHLDWVAGTPMPGFSIPAKYVKKFDLAPKEITAALIGLKNRAAVFKIQRTINEYAKEPLLGVLPGVALEQLWQVIDVAEKSLLAVSAMVVVVGLSGLIAVILASINERRRELAILRSVGARPRDVFFLLLLEGFFVSLLGIIIGAILLNLLTLALAPIAQSRYGILIQASFLSGEELGLLGLVLVVGLLASLIPAYRAYQLSLIDGLTPKI